MKRTIASLFTLATSLVLTAPGGQAGETCSNATLEGSYAAKQSAFFFEDRQQESGLGVITFDGKGNWSGAVTFVSQNGVQRLTPSGTYAVNPDCTGFSGPSLTADIVIIDGGKEVYEIITSRVDRVVTWTLKKQFPERHHHEED